MPKEWTDITAQVSTLAELKVVEYVLKHTWGYQEFGIAKKITTDEFMYGRKRKDGTRMDQGTGLSLHSVIDGLKAAVRDGLLVEEINASDRARVKKFYALKMRVESQEEEVDEKVEASPSHLQTLQIGVQSLQRLTADSADRTEKDTTERSLQKDSYLSKFRIGRTFPNAIMNRSITGDSRQLGTPQPNEPKPSRNGPFSSKISHVLDDLSKNDLHDPTHIRSNVTRALNLWRQSEMEEQEFLGLVRDARRITLERAGSIRKKAHDYLGLKNHAPYFFQVLFDLIRKQGLNRVRAELLIRKSIA
jgi:hypothetical protein